MKSSDIFELNLKTVWRPVNSRQPNHNRNKSRKIPQSKYECMLSQLSLKIYLWIIIRYINQTLMTPAVKRVKTRIFSYS